MTICNCNVFINLHQWFWYNFEIDGAVWQVAPESKIQLVGCELSPKTFLILSTLEDICAKYMYIFCESICSVFLSKTSSIFRFVRTSFQLVCVPKNCLFWISGFGKSAFQWFSDPHLKHLFGFLMLYTGRLSLVLHEFIDELNFLLPFPLLCCFKNFSVGCDTLQWLYFEWANLPLSIALTGLSKFK